MLSYTLMENVDWFGVSLSVQYLSLKISNACTLIGIIGSEACVSTGTKASIIILNNLYFSTP